MLIAALRSLAVNERQESKELDFKCEFYPEGSSAKEDWCEIVKDIAAFANTGGGVIVFGCDSQGRAVPFSIEKLSRLDPAKVTDQMRKYTDEHFAFIRSERVTRRRKVRLAWMIGPSEYPLIFTKDPPHTEGGKRAGPAFHIGQVYFRHGAKSEPGTPLDLRDFFDRELARRQSLLTVPVNQPQDLTLGRVGGVAGATLLRRLAMTYNRARHAAEALPRTAHGPGAVNPVGSRVLAGPARVTRPGATRRRKRARPRRKST